MYMHMYVYVYVYVYVHVYVYMYMYMYISSLVTSSFGCLSGSLRIAQGLCSSGGLTSFFLPRRAQFRTPSILGSRVVAAGSRRITSTVPQIDVGSQLGLQILEPYFSPYPLLPISG